MTPRNTRTGAVLEQMVLPALRQGGYRWATQVNIGRRLGLGKHIVDAVAKGDGSRFLISMKWQQTAGTAEQKVPFEVICLHQAVLNGSGQKAFLVLGGEGWTLRNFYTSGGLEQFLNHLLTVEILTLEAFVARANSSEL